MGKMEKLADCPNCGSTITTPKEMKASLDDGRIYCPTCSHVIKADEFSDEESSEDDETEFTDEDELDETITDEDIGENDGELFDTPPMSSEYQTTEEAPVEETPVATVEETDSGSNPDVPKPQTIPAPPSDPPQVDNPAPETPEEQSTTTDSLNATLMPMFANKEVNVEVVPNADHSKWYLFADKSPVAVSEVSRAGESVQSIFKTDQYKEAFSAATSDGVTQETLDSFGFEPTSVDVPIDEAVRQTVEAMVNEKIKEYDDKAANLVERFQTCVGIAAVGINKGSFGKNPLKAALTASLKNVGVRNAEIIVDDAFEKHGEDAQREIVEKALDLMDKTPETLNEVAAMVEQTPFHRNTKSNTKTVVPFASFASNDIEADQNSESDDNNVMEASDGEEDYSQLFRSISNRQ